MKFHHIGKAATGETGGSPLTRRKFLRNSSGASAGVGVGLIVTSKTALGQEGTKDSILRCGIIGYGEQGEALQESSLPLKDIVRFTAVADIWETKRNLAVKRITDAGQGAGADGATCTGYEDAEEMLKNEELDCVIVATPDFVHHKYAIMGLEYGKDVYSEKLMSNSIDFARQMVQAQQRTGKLLQIGHQRRSNPRYLHAKNIIIGKNNLLGWITHMSAQWNRGQSSSLPRPIPAGKEAMSDEVLQKYGYNGGAMGMFEFRNWRMFKKFGGGVISDLGAHQIDLFNWFLDTTPNSIFAQGGTDFYTGEFLHEYLTSDVKEKMEKTKSSKLKKKLADKLALLDQVTSGYEYADNVMAFYEYETPRAQWGTKAGAGDVLKTRAYYQVLTTSSSQKFYEKFMGEFGTLAISELPDYNQIYREPHAEDWDQFTKGANPDIQKDLSQEDVYNRFWEKPAPWRAVSKAKHDKWLDLGNLADARVSANPKRYELPDHVQLDVRAHTPHLRNFFETVRDGGSQDDLNCPAMEGFKTCVTCMKVHEALAAGTKLEFKPEDFAV